MQSSDLDMDTLTLDFTASISQTLHISSEWKPLIDINASFTLDGKIRPQEMSSTLAMTNLIVVDRVTQHAVLPNLLSWQLTSDADADTPAYQPSSQKASLSTPVPFILQIVKNTSCLKVHATSLPVEFCVNKPCVAELVHLAMYVVDSDALKAKVDANLQEVVQLYEAGRRRALKRAYIIKQRLEAEAAAAAIVAAGANTVSLLNTVSDGSSTNSNAPNTATLRIEISVELNAPKLIIPQECTNDALGCLR